MATHMIRRIHWVKVQFDSEIALIQVQLPFIFIIHLFFYRASYTIEITADLFTVVLKWTALKADYKMSF